MAIPVCGGLYHGVNEFVDILKPTSCEGQAAQLLPPKAQSGSANRRMWG
jgi:hypothetical protein